MVYIIIGEMSCILIKDFLEKIKDFLEKIKRLI